MSSIQNPLSVSLNTPQWQRGLDPEQRKLAKACSDFETVLVKQMLEAMQGSTPLFGKGFGGEYFQSLFQEELSKEISVNGLGVGKMMFEQLNQAQNSKKAK
ncbi:rod binding protein [Hydrogenispora ethanolica]|uniref:Rod binding protein n=1 Tax=Hydrogenispora ethanolica TaxID=1082276 RepID=A0A4R1S7A2_HYDET|nr:rod-binding protein [Hydrogenispora ethanolica]TCL75273.1 rod binding protein [Hydrogenispora ethanolica]